MTLSECLKIINTSVEKKSKPEIKLTYNDVVLSTKNSNNILYDVSKKEGGKQPQITYFVYE